MLTIEELLKPRIKVTGPYPHSPYQVGEQVKSVVGRWHLTTTAYRDEFGENIGQENYVAESTIAEYPNLFQRLEWWQERKPEDMPEYVKLTSGTVLKITKYDFSINSIWVAGGECTLSAILTNTTPATLDEYLTYKNKTDGQLPVQ